MDTAGGTLTENQVRERAYFIWEREGRPHGRDGEHWIMAERELLVGTGSPSKITKSIPRPKKQPEATKAGAMGNGAVNAKGPSGKAGPRKTAAKSVSKATRSRAPSKGKTR